MDPKSVDILTTEVMLRAPLADPACVRTLLGYTDCDGKAFAHELPEYCFGGTSLLYVLENRLAMPLSTAEFFKGMRSRNAGYVKSIRNDETLAAFLRGNSFPYTLLGEEAEDEGKYLRIKPFLIAPALHPAVLMPWEWRNEWYTAKRRTA